MWRRDPSALLGISAHGSDATQPPQLKWGCPHVTDFVWRTKLDCSLALGTHALSAQRAESFRHFLLLPSPSVVYHGRKPTNLRISFRASASQFQTSGLRVRSHARACSPAAQRTGKGYAGRCAEVVEARSIAAFDWRCGSFLAKEVLRFQHSKLPAVCGKAALYSSKSGQAGLVRASGGLGVEQFSPLCNRL